MSFDKVQIVETQFEDGTTVVVEVSSGSTTITRWHSCQNCEVGSLTVHHRDLS